MIVHNIQFTGDKEMITVEDKEIVRRDTTLNIKVFAKYNERRGIIGTLFVKRWMMVWFLSITSKNCDRPQY